MRFRARVFGFALALLGLSLPVAAETPGVTEDTIKIGILGSLTGPAAVWGSGNLAGGQLAFEEVNAKGGIHGRKLEWVIEDDETSSAKGIAAYRKLVGQEQVFAVFGPASSSISAALLPTIKAFGVPTFISVPSTPAVTEPMVKNIFRTGPLNDHMQGEAIADYVIDGLKAERIAIIRQSDEYGKRGTDAILGRLSVRNVEPVAHEVFGAGDTDFTSQILKIRPTDPDILIVYGYPSPSAIITRQAKQLGLEATILGSNAASSRKYPEIVGAAAAGTQNVITLAALPESDDPIMAAFRKRFEERYPDLARQQRPDLGDVLGYGGALAFIEGVKSAGPDLTREGFIEALEGLKNFETGLTMPTTFSETSHEGNHSARIVEIQEDLSRKLLPTILTAETAE